MNKYLLYMVRRPPRELVNMSRKAGLVIATSPTVINAIIEYKIARDNHIPLVVDVRDIWEEYARVSRSRFSRILVDKIISYYYEALNYASLIIVTTDKMKQYYCNKIDCGKIWVIYNGTDPSIIKCDSDHGMKDKDLVYLADFNNPYHAVEHLLHALKYSKLSLQVIGGGKYLERIKRLAEQETPGRVRFTGRVKYENLAKYLCRAKVGVVGRPFTQNPEYLYTIPVKIYDYLAAELPVAGMVPLAPHTVSS